MTNAKQLSVRAAAFFCIYLFKYPIMVGVPAFYIDRHDDIGVFELFVLMFSVVGIFLSFRKLEDWVRSKVASIS